MYSRSTLTIFTTRIIRLFIFGSEALMYLLFLTSSDGLDFSQTEKTFALVLLFLSDFIKTNIFTKNADSVGRRVTLAFSSLLIALYCITCYYCTSLFSSSSHSGRVASILFVSCFGIVSPSSSDLGPNQSIEQSILSDLLHEEQEQEKQKNINDRLIQEQEEEEEGEVKVVEKEKKENTAAALASLLSLYGFLGKFAVALGTLTTGFVVQHLKTEGTRTVFESYQLVFGCLGCLACLLSLLYSTLPYDVEKKEDKPQEEENKNEAQTQEKERGKEKQQQEVEEQPPASALMQKLFGFKTKTTERRMLLTSSLFACDAAFGALSMQSYISLYMNKHFGTSERELGYLLMGINLFGGLCVIFLTKWFTKKLGLITTMLVTHAPSCVLLATVPAMPNEASAFAVLILRSGLSDMDVPARQAYVSLIVPKSEKTAANGLSNSSRSLGLSVSVVLLVALIHTTDYHSFLFSAPMVIAGVGKVIYDFVCYFLFTRETGEVGKDAEQDNDNRKTGDEKEKKLENEKTPLASSK